MSAISHSARASASFASDTLGSSATHLHPLRVGQGEGVELVHLADHLQLGSLLPLLLLQLQPMLELAGRHAGEVLPQGSGGNAELVGHLDEAVSYHTQGVRVSVSPHDLHVNVPGAITVTLDLHAEAEVALVQLSEDHLDPVVTTSLGGLGGTQRLSAEVRHLPHAVAGGSLRDGEEILHTLRQAIEQGAHIGTLELSDLGVGVLGHDEALVIHADRKSV